MPESATAWNSRRMCVGLGAEELSEKFQMWDITFC